MTTIEKLALIFESKFEKFGRNNEDVDFYLIGSKIVDSNNLPACSMQVLEDNLSDFKRRIGNDRYRTELTTIQFNFTSKTMLEDLKFMKQFTAFLQREFAYYKYNNETENDIEFVKYSSIRDMTEVSSGTTLYSKSVDVTFNYFEKYIVEEVEIKEVKGITEARANDGSIILEKDIEIKGE